MEFACKVREDYSENTTNIEQLNFDGKVISVCLR
jgi:hypothetical protein